MDSDRFEILHRGDSIVCGSLADFLDEKGIRTYVSEAPENPLGAGGFLVAAVVSVPVGDLARARNLLKEFADSAGSTNVETVDRLEDALSGGSSMPLNPAGFWEMPVPIFVALTICTLGLFSMYWMYRQWKGVRASTGSQFHPIFAGISVILFFYPLATTLFAAAEAKGFRPLFSPFALTVTLVSLLLLPGFPSEAARLLPLLVFAPFVPLLHAIAFVQGSKPSHYRLLEVVAFLPLLILTSLILMEYSSPTFKEWFRCLPTRITGSYYCV